MINTVEWKNQAVIIIDQAKIPWEEVYIECRNHEDVAAAIRSMKIRGAPAIGIAAAMGLALAAYNSRAKSYEEFQNDIKEAHDCLAATRPTAVNLFWALARLMKIIEKNKNLEINELKNTIIEEAKFIKEEDILANKKMGELGKELIHDGARILTHCNAGALATGGYGTALGVIRSAFYEGKKILVYVDETRPMLQGARLTAWELYKEGIPVRLICDNMAASLMSRDYIDIVIVGADRIAQNGDTANKIGTYGLAILAKEHKIPFYIAAPVSTIDFEISAGNEIPIEERNPSEVKMIFGKLITPGDVESVNPAFDVTPAEYISAIVTEKGILKPPFIESISQLRLKW